MEHRSAQFRSWEMQSRCQMRSPFFWCYQNLPHLKSFFLKLQFFFLASHEASGVERCAQTQVCGKKRLGLHFFNPKFGFKIRS